MREDGKQRFRWNRTGRVQVSESELRFIIKLGRIDREEALALLAKHHGDQEAVFAELAARRPPRS
ncbi:hypothetical protein [Mesorhizobium sp. B1-1-8]|uniref:hypothetical protein n=1 Tax=Mesorhizobium sp. B1-1-8 TaxID=2589976 RepID=UPI00112A9075|nr:hypothetical protein [Mesorhizobium sp. B1-1-8]UCI10546.1 hypothetical protein FJ974_30075 [Mesorhizobium sp. B1-1-8]